MTDLKLNKRILDGDQEALEHIARALEGSALPGSNAGEDAGLNTAPAHSGAAEHDLDPPPNGHGLASEPPASEPPASEPPATKAVAAPPLALPTSSIETLLEAMPAAIGVLKADRLVTVNSAFAYAFGYRSPAHLMEAGGLGTIMPQGLAATNLSADGVTEKIEVFSRSRRRLNVAFALTLLDAAHDLRLLRLLDETDLDGRDLDEAIHNEPARNEPKNLERNEGRHGEAEETSERCPNRDVAARQLEFLAKVSHEVRTPLNSIIGFAELMLHERFGPIGNARYKGYADDIHQSGLYALSLLNDLLDISKIEAGKFEVDFTAVDVADVIEACVASLQPLAKRTRIVLRSSFSDDLPLIVTDPRRLRQVMLNLLTNAIKFTNEGGQVIVSGMVVDGDLRLRVHDSGVGMSKSDIAYAMQPFHQLDTSPRHQSGTGLGLPLTKALADVIRARLELSSEPGIGTSADVIFPADRLVNP